MIIIEDNKLPYPTSAVNSLHHVWNHIHLLKITYLYDIVECYRSQKAPIDIQ